MTHEEVLAKLNAAGDLQRRYLPISYRDDAGSEDGNKLEGHASVFNADADLGYFVERVMPGTFRDTILDDDIRCLFNHNDDIILGRNKANTLRLSEDDRGLFFSCDLPDTSWGRDIRESVKRRDVTQCSIGFTVISQRVYQENDVWYREISKARLWDVSPVTFPAFVQTDVAVRTAERAFRSFAEFRRGTEDPQQLIEQARAAEEARALADIDLRLKALNLVRI